jgi:uncharacterized membrane protein YadS
MASNNPSTVRYFMEVIGLAALALYFIIDLVKHGFHTTTWLLIIAIVALGVSTLLDMRARDRRPHKS